MNATIAFGTVAVLAFAAAANASEPTAQEQTRMLKQDQVTVTPRVDFAQNGRVAMAPMALNSLSNPPTEIATARVVDDQGTVVGAVQKIDIDGGKPSKVEIALLGSNQIVALDAGQLSYDKSNNVLTAALDKSQIVQMPVVPAG